MFITQTNDFGSLENRAAYLSKQKSDKFYPTPTPKYSMLKHFDVIQKLVPSKDHFNNKKHYKCKNAILKQKIHYFLNFPKPMCQKLVAMAT